MMPHNNASVQQITKMSIASWDRKSHLPPFNHLPISILMKQMQQMMTKE